MFRTVRLIGFALALALPGAAIAQTSAEQLAALLQQVSQLQAQLQTLNTPTITPSTTVGASAGCVILTQNLGRGSFGDEVLKLQRFLVAQGLLHAVGINGQFDAATEIAVQKWQASHSVVSSGTPETTGYGAVGPRTRFALANNCQATTNTQVTTTQTTQQTNTVGQCPYIPIPSTCSGQVTPIRSGGSNSCIVGWQCSQAGAGSLPAQSFNASPTSGSAPLSVTFSGVVTSANAAWCNGSTCTNTLDFGDGNRELVNLPSTPSTALQYSITHAYRTPGSYVARLFQGDTNKPLLGSQSISVGASTGGEVASGAPFISLSLAPTSVKVGQQLAIRWAVRNASTTSAVRLKIDGGASVASGLDAEQATTTYNWLVPTMTKGSYKIIAEMYAGSNTQASASQSFSVRDDLASVCLAITHNMGPDDTDSTTDGDVSRLQTFLALDSEMYPEGRVSGFYGPATVRAVQRWQSAHGILSSGSPESNGYGAVGPRTRAAMTEGCSGGTAISATPRSGNAPFEVTFTLGAVSTTYFGGTKLEFGDGTSIVVCSAGTACTASTTKHTYNGVGVFTAKYIGVGEGSNTTIGSVSINTTGSGGGGASCAEISNPLKPEDTDETTDGDVSRLQQFLAKDKAIYPEGLVTGYYGPATVRAVQRWQAAKGIVSSGTPETTGYGAVGPRTLALIACAGQTSAGFSVAPTTGEAPLATRFTIAQAPDTYLLDFGDGTTLGQVLLVCATSGCTVATTTVAHTYTTQATYTAKLFKYTRPADECAGLSGTALDICNVGRRAVYGTAKVTVKAPVACPSGQVRVAGQCVTNPDPNACPVGKFIHNGQCVDSCPTGTSSGGEAPDSQRASNAAGSGGASTCTPVTGPGSCEVPDGKGTRINQNEVVHYGDWIKVPTATSLLATQYHPTSLYICTTLFDGSSGLMLLNDYYGYRGDNRFWKPPQTVEPYEGRL